MKWIVNKVKYLIEYYIICHGSPSKYGAYVGKKIYEEIVRGVMQNEDSN